MFVDCTHSFFSKWLAYKTPRIRMKLKASVLGSVGSWLFGGGGGLIYLFVGILLLREQRTVEKGCALEVGVSCGPATALNLGRASPSWAFDFPFWVGNHLLEGMGHLQAKAFSPLTVLFGLCCPSIRKTEPCLSLDKIMFPDSQNVFTKGEVQL